MFMPFNIKIKKINCTTFYNY